MTLTPSIFIRQTPAPLRDYARQLWAHAATPQDVPPDPRLPTAQDDRLRAGVETLRLATLDRIFEWLKSDRPDEALRTRLDQYADRLLTPDEKSGGENPITGSNVRMGTEMPVETPPPRQPIDYATPLSDTVHGPPDLSEILSQATQRREAVHLCWIEAYDAVNAAADELLETESPGAHAKLAKARSNSYQKLRARKVELYEQVCRTHRLRDIKAEEDAADEAEEAIEALIHRQTVAALASAGIPDGARVRAVGGFHDGRSAIDLPVLCGSLYIGEEHVQLLSHGGIAFLDYHDVPRLSLAPTDAPESLDECADQLEQAERDWCATNAIEHPEAFNGGMKRIGQLHQQMLDFLPLMDSAERALASGDIQAWTKSPWFQSLDEHRQSVIRALNSTAGTDRRLAELLRAGDPGDDQLLAAAGRAFGISGSGPGYSYWGGKNPRVQIGTLSEYVEYKGKSLVEIMRDVLGLAEPIETASEYDAGAFVQPCPATADADSFATSLF